MNMNQFNNLGMYGTVSTVLNSNRRWWTGFAPFANAAAALDEKIAEIKAEALRQDEAQRGIAREKALCKEELTGLAAQVAFNIRGYAADQGDERLKHLVRFTPSQLSRSRDMLLVTRASLIHQEAVKLLGQLKEYRVTPEIVMELQVLTGTFTQKMNTPRAAIASKAACTRELRVLFRKTDRLLKDKLDIMMFNYRTMASLFYNVYTSARVIVDSHRHGELLTVTLNPGETTLVHRLVFDAPLTNTGVAVLSYVIPRKEGPGRPFTLQPGKSEKLRAAEGMVEVTNTGEQESGSFTVRVTSTRPVNGEKDLRAPGTGTK